MSPAPRGRGLLGRADLVAALAAGDAAAAGFVGERLGLSRSGSAADETPEPEDGEAATAPAPAAGAQPLPQVLPGSGAPAPVPFWLPESAEFLTEDAPDTDTAAVASAPAVGWRWPPPHPPLYQPLAPWAELAPRLRRCLSHYREGRAIDLDRTIECVSRGRSLARLPRERRRRFGPALMLLEDDSRRLIPFRLDRRLVRHALGRLLPAPAFGRALVGEGLPEPYPVPGSALPWPPPPGTLVLALGDCGALAVAGGWLRAAWLALGRVLIEGGCHPLVLFPGPVARCPPDLAAVWRPIPWERPRGHDGATGPERADRLLRLLSPASRIEPGLLRAARLLLPPEAADAATECDLWQHPDLVGHSAAAAGIDLERARVLREALPGHEPLALRRRLLRVLRAWRRGLPEEIWLDELLNADPEARATGPETPDLEDLGPDLEDARAYFSRFCAEVPPDAVLEQPGHDQDWLERIRIRSTRWLWADPAVGAGLAERADALVHGRPEAPSDGIAAALLPARGAAERRWTLVQRGGGLAALPAGAAPAGIGSPLGEVAGRARRLDLEVVPDPALAFWEDGRPPAWAWDWGGDRYGPWVRFRVEVEDAAPVVQRMRWIAPGDFLMGSSADEAGRWDDEGPQHRVRIGEGYWLFDTACTQALWAAVMGENPSRFQGAERPVEQVSWNQVQDFIERINARLPGLDLCLPSEAQWEYACRAGTTTPFSFGANITPDEVNYYGDYPYADGAKGLFRGETVPVASLPANPWGLFEMQGNVWEWVQDLWHPNYKGAPADGEPWEADEPGAARVFRGGSWGGDARFCRCASRRQYPPDSRLVYLGFRCARVQVP